MSNAQRIGNGYKGIPSPLATVLKRMTDTAKNTEYAGNYVYSDNESVETMKLQFINHPEGYIEPVANLYKQRFGETISIIKTNYQTAELIKYMNNCFFATKVSFLNEMYMIAEKSGADWDMAVEGFIRDGRIGHSHLAVPGPDGKFGFGGSCFPKDMQAIISYAKTLGIDLKTLSGAWETNLKVRPEKDWEKLKGRAVV